MTICILGRQPAIGLAELEALYGADAVRPVEKNAALVDAEVDFVRLGGSQKAGEVLTTIAGSDPQKALLWLQKNISDIAGNVDGKLKLGVSIYGATMSVAKLNANVLSLKKVLRERGQSVRVVPNTELELSSAQTHHNNLTDERGCEIMIVRDGGSLIIARATDVQDIDAYRKRDQERPHRDTFVGMLPPKLAQTIVNLAAADKLEGVVLDPFCGTGVVLQEAALMRYEVYGTDLEEKMVRYSRDNLNWLQDLQRLHVAKYYETADATDHTWRKPIDIVACEGYLGHPFSSEPSKEALLETIQTSNVIMKKFLANIGDQLTPGTRLCIAAPAWFVRGHIHHLPVSLKLNELGYERISFRHAKNEQLIYRRADQVVGRELLVLKKK